MILFVKQGEKYHLHILLNNNELHPKWYKKNDTMILLLKENIFSLYSSLSKTEEALFVSPMLPYPSD